SIGDETMTQTGALLGTPAYMSPEQVTGGVVDGRADLYAAGATLFTLASGRMRFSGMEPTSILLKVSREPTPTLFEAAPSTSPALARLVAKATALSPRDRFASGADMAAALEATEEWQVFGNAAAARFALARFMRDVDGVRIELNEQLRDRHLARAAAAEARGAVDAALLARRAASLCTDEDTVMREPANTPQITDVLNALEATPTAPGLLKRAADLYRGAGVPRLAAAYLLRYLQERPGDSVAATQLAILVDGGAEHASSTTGNNPRLATRDIVAGINTGGPANAAVVQTRHRERPAPNAAPATTRPTLPAHTGPTFVVTGSGGGGGVSIPGFVWVMAAVVVAGVVFAIFGRFVDRTVDAVQMTVSDNTEQVGRIEVNDAERRRTQQLQKAQGLFERGSHQAVVTTVNELLASRPPADVVLEAVLLRAASREALNDGVSARLDLEMFLRESGVDDPRRPTVKKKLDEFYGTLGAPPSRPSVPSTIPTAGGLQ
ncbi:MAG TPA: hypothetical protein VGF99_14365, partial [Myxococcota bacterium]